ncbi:glycosyltransferase family 4 protein [Rugamonas apoptosis]|nr:glycosyltransferase family 4 protein [Rugamonas apoptosis]
MVGTRFDTMGGISAVVNVYRAAGLFQRYPIIYLATHCDGGALAKLAILARALLRYAGLLLTGQVGLVHVHVSRRASFWRKALFFLPAFLFRVPAVLHLHSGAFHQFYEQDCGPLRQRLVRYIFDHAAHIVVLSRSWQAWVGGMSANGRISAIYNPVQLPQQATGWERRTAGQTLCFGRLGHNKGTYDLLQAARGLAAPWRLRLGGDGEIEQVRARASELGLAEHVELLGWVSGQAKQDCLDSATLYVLPSYNEGLPMSVLEAMAAGLPVLTTPVGGIPEAVTDGVEGFLVTPGDVDSLAERWARLLAEPELARQMGAAARRKVETTFSTQAVLPQLEAIYHAWGFAQK